jgi:hypothetical protein
MKPLVPFAVVALLTGCNPEFSNRSSRIDTPRVLGGQSIPAEVAPKGAVGYRILAVTSAGTQQNPRVDWAYCTQPKSVSESDDFSAACLGTGEQIQRIGSGSQVSAKIPANACAQFGPDIPATKPGQPQARPADADSTGGYFQPVMLTLRAEPDVQAFAETRLDCGLANSSIAQAQDFSNRSKPNENPELSDVVAVSLGSVSLSAEDAETPLEVSAGTAVLLRASWPECPAAASCGDGICSPSETVQNCPADCTDPHGCGGAEPYAYLDPVSHELVDRHEAMRVSWFASDGEYTDDHTGRLEDEYTFLASDNTWTAPTTPGPVFLWVVLRDSRGGTNWKSFRLNVQ